MKKLIKSLAVLAAFALGIFVFSCGSSGTGSANLGNSGTVTGSTDGTQIYQATGVVKEIDSKAKKVSIDHDEIPGLMSDMQMTFDVKDAKVLEGVAVGEEVDFELERNGSDLTVTKILSKGGKELAGGARIFKANCARCHGDKGEGTKKGISLVKGHALRHPREDFIDQVTNGEDDKMPSFKDKLSEEQIGQVVDYVRNDIQKGLRHDTEETHDH